MSDYAFKLSIRSGTDDRIVITAYDDLTPQWDSAGRIRLTVEVRHAGKVVFPKGQLTCALHGASDGLHARELVMALVGMHPSDGNGVGDDYYTDYTAEQIDWAEVFGERISMEREARYCDPETGEVKRTRRAA
jgi:hypothetical protein